MFNDEFVPWALNHVSMNAASVVDIAGAGGGDGGETDGGATGEQNDVSGGEGSTETTDGGVGETQPNSESELQAAKQEPEAKVDGRALPAKVRELMESLKASDPKAHGWLKDELFANRAFRQEFPGGLNEAKQLRDKVQTFEKEFPGGIDEIKSERDEWRGIDEAWAKADPKVIDVWMEANPQAFAKLMPTAINRFADSSPEEYQRHMAGIIVSTLANGNVVGSLRFLDRAIQTGDKEGAASLIKDITEWIGGIDQLAKSKPKVADQNPALDARKADLDAREDKLWVDSTARDVNSFKTSAVKKELAQYSKGQTIDDETYEAIERQALQYLNTTLMADPQFSKIFKAYCDQKDTDGVSRYMKSKLTELLPSKVVNGKTVMGPVERAYKLFFRGAAQTPKPKPNVTKPNGNAVTAPKGWEKVGAGPHLSEIDMKQSPFEMRFKQAAILKSGKKVFWGANAPE